MNIPIISRARLLVFLITILFPNLIIKAESEAEKRASDRRLKEIIAQDEERINREADRIYNERYGSGKQDIFSIIPFEVFQFFIGVFAILGFVYMFASAWEQSYGPIGSQKNIPKRIKDPEHEALLENLRQPLNPSSKQSILEYLSHALSEPLDKLLKNKKVTEVSKKKDRETPKISIGLLPCTRCGEMLNVVALRDKEIYTCPYCRTNLKLKKDVGFSIAKTNPCCWCRGPIVVNDLSAGEIYKCPNCYIRIRYQVGQTMRDTSFAKIDS